MTLIYTIAALWSALFTLLGLAVWATFRDRRASEADAQDRYQAWLEAPARGPWAEFNSGEVDEYHRLGAEHVRRAMEDEA